MVVTVSTTSRMVFICFSYKNPGLFTLVQESSDSWSEADYQQVGCVGQPHLVPVFASTQFAAVLPELSPTCALLAWPVQCTGHDIINMTENHTTRTLVP
jgi:hypothetical protein